MEHSVDKPSYVRDEPTQIPLSSSFANSLRETVHGNLVEVKEYRPNSVKTVYRYADLPIKPVEQHPHGKPTKSRYGSVSYKLMKYTDLSS